MNIFLHNSPTSYLLKFTQYKSFQINVIFHSINRNSKLWVLDIGIFCFNFMIFVLFLKIFHWGRAKHIKASPRVNCNEDKYSKKHEALCPDKDESCKRILNKVKIILWTLYMTCNSWFWKSLYYLQFLTQLPFI